MICKKNLRYDDIYCIWDDFVSRRWHWNYKNSSVCSSSVSYHHPYPHSNHHPNHHLYYFQQLHPLWENQIKVQHFLQQNFQFPPPPPHHDRMKIFSKYIVIANRTFELHIAAFDVILDFRKCLNANVGKSQRNPVSNMVRIVFKIVKLGSRSKVYLKFLRDLDLELDSIIACPLPP